VSRSALEVRDLHVTYDDGSTRSRGAVTAVDGVSLDVAEGEIVALLGPSGCGKSSLLRAVAGLEPVAGGSIAWAGDDLDGVPVHRRGFGLMFQDGQLFPHRDVSGNVAYGLRMAGARRHARDERVRELLGVVGLDGYGARPVATLSGGERQRVALARALAPRPRLLLLDEPLSALDRALRERLATDLRAALRATGTTAVFVTHDHDEAFEVADRVAVMSAGHLLQVASPEVLWREPASREVARFLGYQAFWPVPDGISPPAQLLAVGPAGLRIVGTAAGTYGATVVSSVFRPRGLEVTVDVDGPVGPERLVAVAGAEAGLPSAGEVVCVAVDEASCALVPS
jgi:thiamine transport system ATP-binding protein